MRFFNSFFFSSKGGLIVEACLLLLLICVASAGAIRLVGLQTAHKYQETAEGFEQALIVQDAIN